MSITVYGTWDMVENAAESTHPRVSKLWLYAPDAGQAGARVVVARRRHRRAVAEHHRPVVAEHRPVVGRRRAVVADARRLVVLVEVGLERKRLSAALARVQLERRVRLHVRAQVGPVGERLAAVRAAEGFLAGVGAQVPLQQPRPREGLVADRAAVLEVVSEHVHRQRRHRHVHLTDNITAPSVEI